MSSFFCINMFVISLFVFYHVCDAQNQRTCEPPCTGPNEMCAGCGACDTKCTDNGPIMCTADCRPPSCGCKRGFVRDDLGTNQCVRRSQC